MNDSWIKVAEHILAGALDAGVTLRSRDDTGLSGRAHVHRLSVIAGPNSAPASVVVKHPFKSKASTYEPDNADSSAFQFFNEWASLRFLTEVGGKVPVAPCFYGGDRHQGLIVMEDFGDGTRLDGDLLGDDPASAEKTFKALMATLGRMHAQTIGKTERYIAIRRALGPIRDHELIQTMRPLRRDTAFREKLDQVGIKVARGFFKEHDELREHWNQDLATRALVHADPCPDNCHWVGSEMRLLDFEHARIAPASMDGVYARAPFPSCWCVSRTPDSVWRAAEDAYRAELIKGCPEARSDDLFHRTMLAAAVHWNLSTGFAWHLPVALEKDRAWGEATVRQRLIYRFEKLAASCDEFAMMPAIGETARRLARRFRELWPELAEMRLYPAFRA